MTVSQGIRLVTEKQAERELLADGFVKATCASCNGQKFFQEGTRRTMCHACEAFGWVWQSPPPKA